MACFRLFPVGEWNELCHSHVLLILWSPAPWHLLLEIGSVYSWSWATHWLGVLSTKLTPVLPEVHRDSESPPVMSCRAIVWGYATEESEHSHYSLFSHTTAQGCCNGSTACFECSAVTLRFTAWHSSSLFLGFPIPWAISTITGGGKNNCQCSKLTQWLSQGGMQVTSVYPKDYQIIA